MTRREEPPEKPGAEENPNRCRHCGHLPKGGDHDNGCPENRDYPTRDSPSPVDTQLKKERYAKSK